MPSLKADLASDPFQRSIINMKRKCEVCRSERSKLLFQQHFSTMSSNSLLDGYDVVVCQDCGFTFANNIPDQASFDEYYRDMSKYEYQDKMGQVSKFDLAKFRTIESILSQYFPDTRARILEIGSSTGALLSLLKQGGYTNILGIDPSPACKETAERLYGIRVLTNTLSDISIEDRSIDVLILVGVLEHVRNLNDSLAKCRNMLSDNGCFFISVPDASRYAEGEDAPYQEFSLEHINFFGPLSLTNLMHANGFESVASKQNLVETNYHTTTAVIHSVYRKSNTPLSLTPDIQTEMGLISYIDQSRQADDRILQIISEIVSSGRRIVVWGTGAHTLRLLAVTQLEKANIRAFVDSNPRYQGKNLAGVPIISPQALERDSGAILISSRVYQHEIEEQIRNNLRLDNQIITLYPMV
jgi:2-polyprenyl-3-methyl-5-hydroxy-6-metoxy-1,4-benzoquinol methylase